MVEPAPVGRKMSTTVTDSSAYRLVSVETAIGLGRGFAVGDIPSVNVTIVLSKVKVAMDDISK